MTVKRSSRSMQNLLVVAPCMIAIWFGFGSLPAITGETGGMNSEPEIRQTFKPAHLELEEAATLFREMTGAENVVVDSENGTIVAWATELRIRSMENLLRTFDLDHGATPREIRVFHLEHMTSREAMGLMRSKLQIREAALDTDRHVIAIRETREKLDQAAKLLVEADTDRK